MLVILTERQLLSPQHVCQGCLMADQSGQPRWHDGRLMCGRALGKGGGPTNQYECQMGFRVANID